MAKPASGTTVNGSQALATNLTAAWGLLEGTGTTSADGTGNGHTLTLSSSGLWGTNGAGDPILHITTGAAAPAAITSPISVTQSLAWSFFFIAKEAGADNLGMVAGDNTVTSDFIWLHNGTLTFRDHGSANFDWTVTTGTTANYLLVRDPTGGTGSAGAVLLYRNGALVNSQDAPTSVNGAITFNTLGNAYTGTTFALVGDIENVLLWTDRKLTGTDASTLNTDPYTPYRASAAAGMAIPRLRSARNRALLRM